ncbi:MAG: dipeptidyl-peptidase-4, partial [Glaciecola sp.]
MTSESTTTILEELDHPERSAHTRRFSLGRPRSYAVASSGDLVLFLRSRGPLDPVLHLWAVDVSGGKERLVVDAGGLLADGDDLPAEERARRERARESASGIVQYSVSADGAVAAFTVAGQLYSVVVASGEVTLESAPLGAYDPHVDPTGTRIG